MIFINLITVHVFDPTVPLNLTLLHQALLNFALFLLLARFLLSFAFFILKNS